MPNYKYSQLLIKTYISGIDLLFRDHFHSTEKEKSNLDEIFQMEILRFADLILDRVQVHEKENNSPINNHHRKNTNTCTKYHTK